MPPLQNLGFIDPNAQRRQAATQQRQVAGQRTAQAQQNQIQREEMVLAAQQLELQQEKFASELNRIGANDATKMLAASAGMAGSLPHMSLLLTGQALEMLGVPQPLIEKAIESTVVGGQIVEEFPMFADNVSRMSMDADAGKLEPLGNYLVGVTP